MQEVYYLVSFFDTALSRSSNPPVSFLNEGLLCLAYLYEKGLGVNKSNEKSELLYKKIKGESKKEAYYNLSKIYKKNVSIYEKYLYKAACKGNIQACYDLGVQLKNTENKKNRAFDFFRRSSDAGHVMATYHLGTCYEMGIGVDVNLNKAFKLYNKSALQFSKKSLKAVKRCYQEGIGCNKNNKKSQQIEEIIRTFFEE